MFPLAPVMLAPAINPTPLSVKVRASILSVLVFPPGTSGAKPTRKANDVPGAKVTGSVGTPSVVKLGFPKAIRVIVTGTVPGLLIVRSTVLLLPTGVLGKSTIPPSETRTPPGPTSETAGTTPRPVSERFFVTPPPTSVSVELKVPAVVGLNRTSTLLEAPAASENDDGSESVKGVPAVMEPVTSAEILPVFETVKDRLADDN